MAGTVLLAHAVPRSILYIFCTAFPEGLEGQVPQVIALAQKHCPREDVDAVVEVVVSEAHRSSKALSIPGCIPGGTGA